MSSGRNDVDSWAAGSEGSPRQEAGMEFLKSVSTG